MPHGVAAVQQGNPSADSHGVCDGDGAWCCPAAASCSAGAAAAAAAVAHAIAVPAKAALAISAAAISPSILRRMRGS